MNIKKFYNRTLMLKSLFRGLAIGGFASMLAAGAYFIDPENIGPLLNLPTDHLVGMNALSLTLFGLILVTLAMLARCTLELDNDFEDFDVHP